MRKGFTLAEVLITLGIIGVIAALTMSIIHNITNQQYVAGLKRAYNVLSNVIRNSEADNGPAEDWTAFTYTGSPNLDETVFFTTYIQPYLNVLTVCPRGSMDNCFPLTSYKFLNNGTGTQVYGSLYGANFYHGVRTRDGISYACTSESGSWKEFIVDVNGPKGPNVVGRDLFKFVLFPQPLGLQPYGSYAQSSAMTPIADSTVLSGCSKNVGNANNFYCTMRVISEGAMNY